MPLLSLQAYSQLHTLIQEERGVWATKGPSWEAIVGMGQGENNFPAGKKLVELIPGQSP